jgi:hypothetical protein
MEYSQIKTPFLSLESIKKEADEFRLKLWGNTVPVDIEKILENKLGISIIPLPDLNRICDTDAFISSDWSSVIVDNEKYMDDKYQNRLRFSIAHEIGHFVLHKDIYESFGISELEDFYNFVEQIPGEQYGYFETQANKFANFLLVPRDILLIEKEKILLEKVSNSDFSSIDQETLNSYIAGPLSSVFEVSADVIEIALSFIKE